jgi:hypothetical protein
MALQQSAVRTNRRHVAGLVQVPEPFPFFDKRSKIFRRVEHLLNTSLGASGVDWHEAPDRCHDARAGERDLSKRLC